MMREQNHRSDLCAAPAIRLAPSIDHFGRSRWNILDPVEQIVFEPAQFSERENES